MIWTYNQRMVFQMKRDITVPRKFCNAIRPNRRVSVGAKEPICQKIRYNKAGTPLGPMVISVSMFFFSLICLNGNLQSWYVSLLWLRKNVTCGLWIVQIGWIFRCLLSLGPQISTRTMIGETSCFWAGKRSPPTALCPLSGFPLGHFCVHLAGHWHTKFWLACSL